MMRRRWAASAAALVMACTWVLTGAPSAMAGVAGVSLWPSHTITYTSTLPPSYAWSVATAVRSWNASGIRVRFVPSRHGALTIGFGYTGGHEGMSTQGKQRASYVHLDPRSARVLPLSSRGSVAELLAHELGHVLGLGHTSAPGCQLMHPTIGVGCPLPTSYQYRCGWFGADDLARARALYGGRPRRGPTFCLLEPAIPALRSVAFSGGAAAGSAVHISWVRPAGLPASAVISIGLWQPAAGTCSAPPRASGPGPWPGFELPASATSWTEAKPDGQPHCYRVWVRSALGQESPKVGTVLTSYAPRPAAPVVQAVTDRADGSGLVDATLAALAPDASLSVSAGSPGACPATSVEGDFVSVQRAGSSWALYVPGEGPVCLSFFALTETGESLPTQVQLLRAPPPDPPASS